MLIRRMNNGQIRSNTQVLCPTKLLIATSIECNLVEDNPLSINYKFTTVIVVVAWVTSPTWISLIVNRWKLLTKRWWTDISIGFLLMLLVLDADPHWRYRCLCILQFQRIETIWIFLQRQVSFNRRLSSQHIGIFVGDHLNTNLWQNDQLLTNLYFTYSQHFYRFFWMNLVAYFRFT